MPLCVPRQVSPADWVTVKQDAHFLIQKHVSRSAPTTPTLRFRLGSSASEAANKTNGPYRILMRCNKLCVGEFNDRTELNNQWRFLHPTDSDLAFDASGHDSMQRLWQEQMVSLQEHAPEQSEADFRDQSSYLASVMSIMELVKSINPGSLNASIEENARMVVLLTSLSRQLLVTSNRLVEKIKGSKLAHDVRYKPPGKDGLAGSRKEIDLMGLEDPIASTSEPGSVKFKTSIEEIPNLDGVEALVYHVERLFDLTSRQEQKINNIVRQVTARKNNRVFLKSEIMSNAVYFLPHIDRDCKAADRRVFVEIAAELEKGLSPLSELYERLLLHLNDRVSTLFEKPNPLGAELSTAIAYGRHFIAENESKIRQATVLLNSATPSSSNSNGRSTPVSAPQEEFCLMGNQTYFDMLKAEVDQYANLMSVTIQMSFETGSQSGERLGDMAKEALKEIIYAHLYHPLMSTFRTMNHSKDDHFNEHCVQLQKVATAGLVGLSKDFWEIVTAENALNEFFPVVDRFIKADSVRLKYVYLDHMSETASKIGSQGLRRIAEIAGKPFDPSKPGDNLRFAVGADDFVPLFAYLLLKANIPDIYSQFAFLSVFTEEQALIGKYGYLLASLQTGIMVVAGIDPSKAPVGGLDFTLIDDYNSQSPKPASLMAKLAADNDKNNFVRTSATTEKPGADPLTTDDWDSDGNVSGEEKDASSAGASSTSSLLSPRSFASKLKSIGKKIGGGSRSRASSAEAQPDSASIKRASTTNTVIKEHQMPAMWLLNPDTDTSATKPVQGDHAYSLALKVFTLIYCLYQRYENKLFLLQGAPNASTNSANLRNDEIFKNFRDEIRHLHRVQLDTLNESQKVVFFINVYHALMMHAFIERDMPDSYPSRFALQASAAYQIGDLTFTLLEIEHGVLRHWSSYPNELMDGIFHFPAKWKTSDWVKASYAPKRPDPRLNFVLCPFASSGPPLHIITTESYELVLQGSTERYLRRTVLVSAEQGVIILPKQLYWYFREFGKKDKNLIDWVSRYLEPSQQEILMSMKKYRIKYNEFDWTFVFSLENITEPR